jgi:hypothetical protein
MAETVFHTNGKTHPTAMGVWKAVTNFNEPKKKAGRPKGSKKTTKAEHKVIMSAFHKKRPPGYGVEAKDVHTALPKKLRKKISPRTVQRRLAEKGYTPQKKLVQDDPSTTSKKKRRTFGRQHLSKTRRQWQVALQAVGDMKDFTWYPRSLQPKFQRIRSSWTYMTKQERSKPAFVRPKRWFTGKQWKKTKKVKVLGFTTSNGKIFAAVCPLPFTAVAFAKLVRQKVAPFFRRAFPGRETFQVLIDGDKVMHAPEAKAALAAAGITALPGWPARSPDLNTQENVWARAEPQLCKLEGFGCNFYDFPGLCLDAVKAYPTPGDLIPSMQKRMQVLDARKGGLVTNQDLVEKS